MTSILQEKMKIKLQRQLSRNEINACRHILCSGSIPPNTQEQVVEVFLQSKKVWQSETQQKS
jgi:hypothetical protein